MPKKRAPPLETPPKEPINLLVEAFKKPDFDFLYTIPEQKQNWLMKQFKAANRTKEDFGCAEQALLEILNEFPKNPFVTVRLAAFYSAHNCNLAAQEMVNKTRVYAQYRKIPLDFLL